MLGKGLESLIPPQRSDKSSWQSPPPQGDDNTRPPHEQPPAVPVPSEVEGSHVEPKLLDDLPAHFARVDFVPAAATSPKPAPSMHPSLKREEKPAKKTPDEYIYHIEVEKIKPNPSQPRRNFDEAGIRELAYSIREFGFLQPLVVTRIERETPEGIDVLYQLIAGERRLMAAKILGLPLVPAVVRHVDLEREKLELAVIENIQREDLNPIEMARAFARLQDEFRLTQREIAAKLGKSREVVANSVRLLSLPIYIQTALEKGELSESHGRLLLAIVDPAVQKKLFDDIISHGMTTRDLRARVAITKPRKTQSHAALSPELKMMEDKLSAELGTPVKIERGAGTGGSTSLTTGKIVITFYSEEELENIVQKIGKEKI